MYYVDRGQGIPIVLLHGFLGSAYMWAPQISVFEDDFRLIAPDIWGHGNSGHLPDGTKDLTEVAQQILMLLEALAVEKFILIGHSVGGMLAGEIALQMPDKVTALALIDTHLGQEPELTKKYLLRLVSVLEEQRGFSVSLIEELQRLFFSAKNHNNSVRLKAAFHHELSQLTQDRIIKSIVPIGRMVFNRRDMSPYLSMIKAASTIVICGHDDLVRPPHEAQQMAALIGCQYFEIPDAGHTPNLESPELVTRVLSEFIYQTLN